jgi:hypothetical protein
MNFLKRLNEKESIIVPYWISLFLTLEWILNKELDYQTFGFAFATLIWSFQLKSAEPLYRWLIYGFRSLLLLIALFVAHSNLLKF